MSTVRRFWYRVIATVRAVAGSSRADDDAREELEHHLAMETAEYVRRGMSHDEAQRVARRVAGGLTLATELTHEQRGLPWFEDVVTDLRYAARSLRNRPGFAVAVVLTLGLCIGANSAMFTIVNAVVLRALPYPAPDRIVSLSLSDKGVDQGVATDRDYFAWLADVKRATLAASTSTRGVVAMPTGPEEMRGINATASYFTVFGVRPVLGRVYSPDEDQPGAPLVVLISESLWRRGFGADSSVIGRAMQLDGKSATIIGVLPSNFSTPSHAEYWKPYRLSLSSDGSTFFYQVIGRLRDGATMTELRAELAVISGRLDASRPAALRGLTPVVMTLHERRFGDRRRPLLLLFGAVVVLLLIGCANLANLTLARTTSRQREIAMRLALGAGQWRIVRYLLSESVLLSAAGAVFGFGLSVGAVGYFVRLSPASVGNVEDIRPDTSVLAFTLVVAVATAALFGALPALVSGRQDLQRALSGGGARAGVSMRQQLIRRLLVVTQLATALVLLTAAGLLARTLARVTDIDPGFRADGLVSALVRLPATHYTDESAGPFFQQLVERVRRMPAVEVAALVDAPPFTLRASFSSRDSAGREIPRIDLVSVGGDYFRAIGARLIEGRAIDESDKPGAGKVVVINATLARMLFPGASAVGKTLAFRENPVVIGVVADVTQRALETAPTPAVYQSLAQNGSDTYLSIIARTSGSMSALERAIAQISQSIDPALPPPTFTRMSETVAELIAPRKFTFVLLGIFAALAATLAVVGLYAVLAQVVSDRTREIGIRAALGAQRSRIVRLILRQGAAMVFVGTAAGLAGAAALSRVVTTLLYGVSARDPLTFTAVPVLLGAVAMLASLVPAWRAARVDPVVALKAD